jgi:cytochrome c-type biogenesis protein CcmH/NrfG
MPGLPARLLVVAPVVAALGWLAAESLRVGEAGSVVYDAGREMAAWAASGAPPDPRAVSRVAAELERAQAATPGDPEIEELLGELSVRRIDHPGFLDEAIAHLSRAIALRPTSPYTWAAIADARYRRGDTGPAFEAALRRAAELGPAEPEVQRTVVDLGLAVWQEEAPATRAAVEETIAGAMKRDAGEVLQIAERRGRLAVACRYIADAPRRVGSEELATCGRREATS